MTGCLLHDGRSREGARPRQRTPPEPAGNGGRHSLVPDRHAEPGRLHQRQCPRPGQVGSLPARRRHLERPDGWCRQSNLAETHTPQIVLRLEGSARNMNPDTLQMSYGMGWLLYDYRGQLLVSHAGAIDGFRAQITLVPHARLGIVLLNNLQATQMNLAAGNNLLDLLLGLPRKDWNAYLGEQVRKEEERPRPPSASAPPGSTTALGLRASCRPTPAPTRSRPMARARVTLEDGCLVWHWNTFTCRLAHYHYDTFVAQDDIARQPSGRLHSGTGRRRGRDEGPRHAQRGIQAGQAGRRRGQEVVRRLPADGRRRAGTVMPVRYFATCARGIEPVLADELRSSALPTFSPAAAASLQRRPGPALPGQPLAADRHPRACSRSSKRRSTRRTSSTTPSAPSTGRTT